MTGSECPESADPRLRELCVWLGTLASWRGGLVGRLVEEYGSIGAVLARPLPELRAFLRPRRRPAEARRSGETRPPGTPLGPAAGEGPADAGADDDHAEQAEESRAFGEVLAATPASCTATAPAPGRLEVAWSDALYPPALRRLVDPPFCLFVAARASDAVIAGRLEVLAGALSVAVVGTRGPSPYGAEMAALLGRDLVLRGIVVVSGLALGVDAFAQGSALRAGAGAGLPTVAVLGSGADVVYPRSNRRLYLGVLEQGLVVSEFAWGVPARRWRFPARNRVMAGLTRAVVVVEGSARSGARITAGFAEDVGSDVLAVPGEAGRKLTQAPHALLRNGAALCESADDVVRAVTGVKLDPELLAGDAGAEVVARLLEARSDDGRLAAVLRALDGGLVTVDDVAAACGLLAPQAAALLTELEVEGLASLSGPGAYRLRRI